MSLTKRFCKMVKATMTAIDPSSAMGIAEGQEFSHDSVYRVLQEETGCFRLLALEQLNKYGGLQGGYLVLDDSFSAIVRGNSRNSKTAPEEATIMVLMSF